MKTLISAIFAVISLGISAQMVFPGDVTLTGTEETVFDYTFDNCSGTMSVDGCPQFFRDAADNIQVVIPHQEIYRLTGPDFDNLTVDCTAPIMSSEWDPDPTNFNYAEWLSSTWTEDGKTIYGLVHNEWHAYDFPGECLSADIMKCWYNGITLVQSVDSGRTFTHAPAPDHLVASVPYQYGANYKSRQGAFGPSNIVKHPTDGYYYVAFYTEENVNGNSEYLQGGGLCVMRTNDLSDPKSWRVYDGQSYSIQSVNPYTDTFVVEDHLLHNVQGGKQMASLSYNTYFDQWMIVGPSWKYNVDQHKYVRGFYYQLSDDLTRWTGPKLIMEMNFPDDSPRNSSSINQYAMYPTVIDHADTSRNFMFTGQDCYLYYTVWNTFPMESSGSPNRDLRRIPIHFSKNYVTEFTITGRGNQYDANPGDGVCATEAGKCSFFAAIQESNSRLPKYEDFVLNVNFDVNGSNFNLNATPFSMTYPIFFDGHTQPGSAENTLGISDGMDAQVGILLDFNGNPGLVFEGGNSGLRGVAMREYSGPAVKFKDKGNNSITGCYIGTDLTGMTNSVPSNGYGIEILNSDSNIVGGSLPGEHNIVVGGITISQGNNNTISGNYCGLTADGQTSLSNNGNIAVDIQNGSNNLIGSTAVEGRNVMAGAYNRAISVEGAAAVSNVIKNNYVGTTADGSVAIGSYNVGVYLSGSSNNTVGDTNAPNVFGSLGTGVGSIVLETGASQNTISGNFIGMDPVSTNNISSSDAINQAGYYLANDCCCNVFENNTITNQPFNAILTNGAAASGNTFSQNAIWNNGGLGIDIFYDGMANENDYQDQDAGPNGMQNHPEFTSISTDASSVHVVGNLHSTPSTAYTVEVFESASCDPSGFGEGRYFVGSFQATTDAAGDASFDEILSYVATDGYYYTATATAPDGSTSEFSACAQTSVPVADISVNTAELYTTVDVGASATDAITISNNGMVDLSWSLSSDQSWLLPGMSSGTVSPGGNTSVSLIISSASLPEGSYSANLSISSNDADEPVVTVTVYLVVSAQPSIQYAPASVTLSQGVGVVDQQVITLQNQGNGNLSWTANSPFTSPWMYVTSGSTGSLSPGGSAEIVVEVNASALPPGDYTSEVVINSNAVDEPFVLIPVSLTVIDNSPVVTVQLFVYQYDFCPGQNVQLEYSVNGPISPNNQFVLELSDATGSFAQPTVLGTYSNTQNNGLLDANIPFGLPAGNGYRFRLRMETQGVSGVNASDITIHPSVGIFLPELPMLCTSSSDLLLPVGSPEGGVWTGPGVSNNSFSPSAVGLGVYELSYHYISPEGCEFGMVENIEVVGQPAVSAMSPTAVCANQDVLTLTASPSGGIWQGTGVVGNTFDPALAGEGVHELTYLYSESSTCSGSATTTITVNPAPTASFGTTLEFCEQSGANPLSGGMPQGGLYEGDFVTNNNFDTDLTPEGVFPVSYTYVDAAGCAATAWSQVEVHPIPNTQMLNWGPVCENSGAVDVMVVAENPVFSGPGMVGNTFDPSLAGPGIHTITCSAVNAFGCSSESQVVIGVLENPQVSMEALGTLCINDAPVLLDVGFPLGGDYTINGNYKDEFDPMEWGVGVHELSYFYTDEFSCMGYTTQWVEVVNAPPAPSISFDGAYLSTDEGADNQWFMNGVAIDGATSDTFWPSESGDYSVMWNGGACPSPMSDVIAVTITGIEEFADFGINVYPNPFSTKIIIESPVAWSDDTEFRLYSESGRLIHFAKASELPFTNGKYLYGEGTLGQGFSQLAPGNYILLIVNNEVVSQTLIQKR